LFGLQQSTLIHLVVTYTWLIDFKKNSIFFILKCKECLIFSVSNAIQNVECN